mgnify:CR=1 FL=1
MDPHTGALRVDHRHPSVRRAGLCRADAGESVLAALILVMQLREHAAGHPIHELREVPSD